MRRTALCLSLFAASLLFAASSAQAQFVTYYSPVVAAPAPVVVSQPVATVVARPVAPVATFVARPVVTAARVVARPVVRTVLRPAPVVVASPVVAAPVVPAAVPVVRTRFRPFLGGTVTRVRYAPAFVPAF